jgi:3-hydroxy-9,10-secoandrosta-1,3,5(10)-triene-9,17-dione monooxygenase reductase component
MSNSNLEIDPKRFRQALGAFTTGVTIVTTHGTDGQDYGLTANSFNSVSVDPPMVLWSLNKGASSKPAFAAAEHFAVHVLATDQESVSNRFAKSGTDKFAGLTVARGLGNVPLLDGCSARFQCRTSYQYEGGDHIIFVGEVLAFDRFDKAPLVFHSGGYRRLHQESSKPVDTDFSGNWLGYLLARAYFQMQLPIRRQLKAMGMRDIDFELLGIFSAGGGRTLEELRRTLEFVGKELSQEDLQPWLEKGLLVAQQRVGEAEVFNLSETGRLLVIQWLAFAKGAEMTALEDLRYEEAQELKVLLGNVIRRTSAGLAEQWRKENIWREDNLWRHLSKNQSAG